MRSQGREVTVTAIHPRRSSWQQFRSLSRSTLRSSSSSYFVPSSEVGATLGAALVVMGDKLGLYRALAGAGGLTPGRARAADRRERALRPRVAERAGRGRLRGVRPDRRHLHAPAGADGRPHRRVESRVPPRLLPDRARHCDRLAADHRGGPQRRGRRLARAQPRRVRWLRALLPARLQREPDRLRGCRRSTASSRSCRPEPRSRTSAAATAPRRS